MPELNRQQFWKSNPNQMALPGMEDLSHPAAHALAQGYHISHVANQQNDHKPWETPVYGHSLGAVTPEGKLAATLSWPDRADPDHELGRGEIAWVNTKAGHSGKGLATSLYGVGRTMARVKPRHSAARTAAGDEWAPKASAKYGGRVPKNKDRFG